MPHSLRDFCLGAIGGGSHTGNVQVANRPDEWIIIARE